MAKSDHQIQLLKDINPDAAEKVKEIIKGNMKALISFAVTILLIAGAVVWGIIRRRRLN